MGLFVVVSKEYFVIFCFDKKYILVVINNATLWYHFSNPQIQDLSNEKEQFYGLSPFPHIQLFAWMIR